MSIIWSWILNSDYGVLNYLLSLIGIEGPDWLVDPAWALFAVILASAFGVGTMMLIFYTDMKIFLLRFTRPRLWMGRVLQESFSVSRCP